MFAEDPLSLIFLACVVFSGGFLIASSVLGVGHLHLGHLGHIGHVGHAGDVGDLGHIGHIGHVGHAGDVGHVAHAASHTASAQSSATDATPTAPTSALHTTLSTLALGALSLYGLLLFLLVFGIVGYLVHGVAHLDGGAAIGLPLAAGFVAAVGVGALLDRLFVTSPESELDAETSHYDGRLATVTALIRPGALGEVTLVRPNGARQSLSARSAETIPLAPGTDVVVLGYEQGIATVQSWESVVANTPSTQTSASTSSAVAAPTTPSEAPPGQTE